MLILIIYLLHSINDLKINHILKHKLLSSSLRVYSHFLATINVLNVC
jgi:hypothetical protein